MIWISVVKSWMSAGERERVPIVLNCSKLSWRIAVLGIAGWKPNVVLKRTVLAWHVRGSIGVIVAQSGKLSEDD